MIEPQARRPIARIGTRRQAGTRSGIAEPLLKSPAQMRIEPLGPDMLAAQMQNANRFTASTALEIGKAREEPAQSDR